LVNTVVGATRRAKANGSRMSRWRNGSPREIDLLDSQGPRFPDGALHRVGVQPFEPWVLRAARIEAVDALEVAPSGGDLHPQR
jgi:hypothetical protein